MPVRLLETGLFKKRLGTMPRPCLVPTPAYESRNEERGEQVAQNQMAAGIQDPGAFVEARRLITPVVEGRTRHHQVEPNIHREFFNRNPTDRQEAQMAKIVSLLVKFGALVFIIFVPTQFAIYLQLLGGIWIIQTLPSVMLGAFTRWFNDWALLIGWAVGIVLGTVMAAAVNLTPIYPLQIAGFTFPGYTALFTVILNIAIAAVLTPLFNAMAAQRTPFDETLASDYHP